MPPRRNEFDTVEKANTVSKAWTGVVSDGRGIRVTKEGEDGSVRLICETCHYFYEGKFENAAKAVRSRGKILKETQCSWFVGGVVTRQRSAWNTHCISTAHSIAQDAQATAEGELTGSCLSLFSMLTLLILFSI